RRRPDDVVAGLHANEAGDAVAFADEPFHAQRVPVRVDPVELDEVVSAADPLARVRPFADDVLGQELPRRLPLARVEQLPETADDVGGVAHDALAIASISNSWSG